MRIARYSVFGIVCAVAAIAYVAARRPVLPADPPSRAAAPATATETPKALGDGKATLSGRVVDEKGPVVGASILITSDEGAFSSATCSADSSASVFDCCGVPASEQVPWRFAEGDGEARTVARAVSGVGGWFQVEGLPPGPYAVWAESDRGHAVALDVSAGGTVELRLAPGIRYAGTASDPGGAPIAAATVAAIPRAHSRFFVARSDERGRFQLGPLPEGDYFVIAAAPGRIPVQRVHPSGSMELTLEPARRVVGKVLRDGRPACGAELLTGDNCSLIGATADVDGRFVLDRLEPGKVWISAFLGDAGGTAEVDLSASDRGDVVIELRPGGAVVGRVRDEDGNGVPGTRVSIESSSSTVARRVTESDGRFRFHGLPYGGHAIRLRPPAGFVTPKYRLIELEEGRESIAQFTLARAARLRGRVVDEEGRPVSDAELTGQRLRGGAPLHESFDERGYWYTRSDRSGLFSVDDAPRGRLDFRVKAAGFLPHKVDLSAPGEVTVKLVRGGTIDLHVVDDGGAPFPGARVTAITPHPEGGERVRFRGETDADGRYTFSGLPNGPYRVVAQIVPRSEGAAHDHVRTVAADASVEAPGRAVIRLRFEKGRAIVGRVVEEGSGRGLAGVEVSARDTMEDPPVDRDSDVSYPVSGGAAITDTTGRFEIRHLRASSHRLDPYLDGFTYQGDETLTRPGDGTVLLRLRPDPRLKGRVVDEMGAPLKAFSVGRHTVRSEDGRFDLAWERDGSGDVLFEAAGYAATQKRLPPMEGPGIDLGVVVLARGRTVQVTVVDVGGRPVRSAQVKVGVPSAEHRWKMDMTVAEGITEADGIAVLGNVPDTPVQVLVSSEVLTSALAALPPETSQLRVALGSGGRIEGIVRNAEGAPVRNVLVTASSFSLFRQRHTGADGRYVIDGLPPDEYSVYLEEEALAGNAGLSWRRVALPPDGGVAVDFLESRGAALTVSFPEKCDRRVVSPGTFDLTAEGIERARHTELSPDVRRDGGWVLRGLPPGVYTILCSTEPPAGGGPTLGSLIHVDVAESDVTLSVPEPAIVIP